MNTEHSKQNATYKQNVNQRTYGGYTVSIRQSLVVVKQELVRSWCLLVRRHKELTWCDKRQNLWMSCDKRTNKRTRHRQWQEARIVHSVRIHMCTADNAAVLAILSFLQLNTHTHTLHAPTQSNKLNILKRTL